LRIISGKARGTKLYTLDGENTRPTLDRIKEPLFSIILNRILDAEVLDLFAGSGALGMEALSRGAKSAILCDNSLEAIKIIKNNLNKTKLADYAEIINKDFRDCLKQLNGKKFDLIFLDPPYKTDYIELAIKQIIDENLLKKDGTIIAETDRQEVVDKIKNLDICIEDIRKYGRAILIFLKRRE
jgi:16S rRNA (guanine(966)-N(2))-methyltransferase RsmD